MILTKITIENFLSIRGPMTVDVDSRVTVLMGANDHGKTNILQALRTLNEDQPIKRAHHNWDAKGNPPKVAFTLVLKAEEKEKFQAIIADEMQAWQAELTEAQEKEKSVEAPPPSAATSASPSTPPTATATKAAAEPELTTEEIEAILESVITLKKWLAKHDTIIVSRQAIDEERRICGTLLSDFPQDLYDALTSSLPRVELFSQMSSAVQDSVTAESIAGDAYEFMQGIFYCAGLDPLASEHIFTHDDETERTLDDASDRLQNKLRDIWNQGAELGIKFELGHRGTGIELYANDPSVKSRKTRMSFRSAGVTQFFTLSMILHARRKKHPANSYIYLFDEPGIFLHPKGQRDLMQVFEELSDETQIVYATHSLFLLNQNFVERHRLIIRDDRGTTLDQKPYRNNWGLALEEMLGIDTASILFAPCVILTEGDSDRFYLVELFRHFNKTGELDADLNHLSIYAYGDQPNLRYLIQRIQKRDSSKVVVLFDGDEAGKRYHQATDSLAKAFPTLKRIQLEDSLAIEDYALFPDLFLKASLFTLQEALRSAISGKPKGKKEAKEPDSKELTEESLRQSINVKQSRGAWFKDQAETYIGDREAASKIVLARTYAGLARVASISPDKGIAQRALALCQELKTQLAIPSTRAEKVVEERNPAAPNTAA